MLCETPMAQLQNMLTHFMLTPHWLEALFGIGVIRGWKNLTKMVNFFGHMEDILQMSQMTQIFVSMD